MITIFQVNGLIPQIMHHPRRANDRLAGNADGEEENKQPFYICSVVGLTISLEQIIPGIFP